MCQCGLQAVSMKTPRKDEDWPDVLDEICPDVYARRCMMAAIALEEFVFEGPAGRMGEEEIDKWYWRIDMLPGGKRTIRRTER